MYFDSRADAGKKLANLLLAYANQNSAVVALNEGGVLVGAEIAMTLHCSLMLLASTDITLPGELDPFAGMTPGTPLTYNPVYSEGQRDEMAGEYHGYIEEQRLEKFHQLNTLLGKEGAINRDLLKRHVVILVADGLPDAFLLDLAADFLKSVKIKKLVVATPLANVSTVDRMHLVGDEVHVLSVLENYLTTSHYYEDNSIPDLDGLFKIMHDISLKWENKTQTKN